MVSVLGCGEAMKRRIVFFPAISGMTFISIFNVTGAPSAKTPKMCSTALYRPAVFPFSMETLILALSTGGSLRSLAVLLHNPLK
jgi:hypothetical protein